MSDIKEFVENMVQHLVDNVEEVKVTEQEGEHAHIIEVRVGQGDMGKVIGKHGRNADALRILVRAVSAKKGKSVTLEINE